MRSVRYPSLGALAIALFVNAWPTAGDAQAQPSKDNTSPPIEVPTTPVPQGPTAPPPPPPKPPPPKPAPPPAAAAPAPAAPAAPATGDKPAEDKKEPSFNNEGVFKISGSKGPGIVGAPKGSKKGTAGEPTAKPAAKGKAAGKGGKASTATVAQWPGFRMTEDGGSEIVVEFSKNPASPTEHPAAGSLSYVFKGAHVIKSNNQNPLITVHFNTPIASARLVPHKGELHLKIEFRPGVSVKPSSGLRASSDGDGQQFFVKLPAGAWLPKGAENEEMPPPPTQKLKGKGKGDTAEEGDTKTAPPPPKTESGPKTGPTP